MNSILISGRLTRDADFRDSQAGDRIATFTLAVSNGADKTADFIDIAAFKGTAAFLEKVGLGKGDKVVVLGSLHIKEYTGKDGQPRRRATVYASQVEIMTAPKNRAQAAAPSWDVLADDDDVPF